MSSRKTGSKKRVSSTSKEPARTQRKQDEKKKHTLRPEYAKYLEYKKARNTKASTLETMRRHFTRFPAPDDLSVEFFERRMQEVKENGEAISNKTVKLELVYAKAFLRWAERDYSHLDTFDVGQMEETVTKADLYTAKELEAIFKHAEPLRDRAMLQVLYETAVRPSELLSMTYEGVRGGPVPNSFIILLEESKTFERDVLVQEYAPSLRVWLEAHPTKTGPLWISAKYEKNGEHKALGLTGLYLIVQKTLAQAKITGKKRILYMFRHNGITYLKHVRGMSGVSLAKYVGWRPGSSMEKNYVHLDSNDVIHELLVKSGRLDANGTQTEEPTQIDCPRCGVKNNTSYDRCTACGYGLNEVTRALDARDDLEERIKNLERIISTIGGADFDRSKPIFAPEEQIPEQDRVMASVARGVYLGTHFEGEETKEEKKKRMQEILDEGDY